MSDLNVSLRCGLVFVAFALYVSARAECALKTLEPKGTVIGAGAFDLTRGEADDRVHPSAWQGPLVTGKCTLELGIIEPPLVLVSNSLLYVPSYSGNMRTLSLVDLAACSVRWRSWAFSGDLRISPTALELGGQRVKLDGNCLPANWQRQ